MQQVRTVRRASFPVGCLALSDAPSLGGVACGFEADAALGLVGGWESADYWKLLLGVAALMAVSLFWKVNTRRYRRALQRADEMLLLAKKAGAGGVWEWYPESGEVSYSSEYFRILGYEPDELEHSFETFQNLLHPDDFGEAMNVQWNRIERGGEFESTFRMKHKEGRWVWILSRGVPVELQADGSVRRYLGVHTDITTLMETRFELERQEKLARKANSAKSAFLASMSHEIRTPMNAILGFTRLLSRDKRLNAQQSEYVQLVNRSGEHLLSLLDDVLDFAKIESGRIELDTNSWDLRAIYDDLVDLYKGRCSEKGLSLICEYDEALPRLIETDGVKLKQVITNLLSNAVKFTESGSIQLRMERMDRETSEVARLTVEDTGYGIGEAEQRRVFTAFAQTDVGRKTRGGTGLGLAISKQFVEMMGGQIAFTSRLGEGTRFEVTLPLKVSESDVAINERGSKWIVFPKSVSKQVRILMADDNYENLLYLRKLLEEMGFNVQASCDGEEALVYWKLFEPHLLVLDLDMPKKDGYTVISEIRSDRFFAQPKILVLSASVEVAQRGDAMRRGADAFMAKPFRERELLGEIARLLALPFEGAVAEEEEVGVNADPGLVSEPVEVSQSDFLELSAACKGGYFRRVEAVVAKVARDHPQVSERLRARLNNFDYEGILRIVRPGGGSGP